MGGWHCRVEYLSRHAAQQGSFLWTLWNKAAHSNTKITNYSISTTTAQFLTPRKMLFQNLMRFWVCSICGGCTWLQFGGGASGCEWVRGWGVVAGVWGVWGVTGLVRGLSWQREQPPGPSSPRVSAWHTVIIVIPVSNMMALPLVTHVGTLIHARTHTHTQMKGTAHIQTLRRLASLFRREMILFNFNALILSWSLSGQSES